MTKFLAEVLRKVAELPEERQDDAANMLLRLLDNDASRYRLSDDQLHEVEVAIAEADSGKFASEEELVGMTLRFAPRAINQLANIREHLTIRRPESAELVRGRILATIGRLRELPRMGDTGGIAGTRELGVAGLPYVIVYRNETADELVILGVFNAAQNR
jgi:plasmid stabilization system protein ParE